jgi:hypothetical protein
MDLQMTFCMSPILIRGIDAPDRHFREALDTIAADVRNVTRNNETVVAAPAPIEVALRTFSSRLTELEGRVDEIISKHSLRDSRAVRHEGQLAKQMGLLKGLDLRLAALADQMATVETAAEGASARVVDAPALEIISPQREEEPEQITSDHSGTTLEGDDSYTA